MRTPLTGLSGYLELILGGQVEDPVDERDFLERSRHIVGSMSDLVGDLLELSRLESGTLRLQIAPFSVAEAGSRVVAGLAPIALARAVELRTSMPPRLRAATGDRRRVEHSSPTCSATPSSSRPVAPRSSWEPGSRARSPS